MNSNKLRLIVSDELSSRLTISDKISIGPTSLDKGNSGSNKFR